MDQAHDAKIYNKQNNQFSNQLSNLVKNPVPVCGPFNVWDNEPNSAQQTYTLVPTAIAQAYQQLLPLANSLQNSIPISLNAQQSQHGTRRMTRSARYRRNKWINKKNRYVQNQLPQNQYSHTHHNPDLRNKITVRRRSCSSFSENTHDGYIKKETGSWNDKKHRNEEEWEETSIQMNLEPLKSLTSSGSESDQWYIVVDTDVILNNFNYLNNMAAADPDCHLLIPHHVMLELQSHASDNNNVQARRIFRFLNEQIQSGLTLLGAELAGEGRFNMAIMTCVKLAAQNNTVILISNNPDTLKYKSNTKYIHVFTIQDVKDILANKSARLYRADSPTLALKITVPNDVVDTKFEQTDDFSTTLFRRTFSAAGQPDPRICTDSVPVRFPEKIEPDYSQTPLTPVSEELPNTVGNQTFLRTSSTDSQSPTYPMLKQIEVNCSNDVNTRNVSRENSVEKIKIVYSPTKRVTLQEHINTDVGVRNLLERSVEPFEMVSSQNPSKRIMHQESVDTDVGDGSMLVRSIRHFKTLSSQSLPQSWTHQEHIYNDVDRNMLSRSVEQFKMGCSQSSPKRNAHQEHGDTDAVDRNMLSRSPKQLKVFSSQSPPKSRIPHQEHVNVDIEDGDMEARSLNQFGLACGLSLQNPRNTMAQKEIVDTNVAITRNSNDNLESYHHQGPSKSASGGSDFDSTLDRDKNAPGKNSSVDNFQSPFKLINRGDYEYSRRKQVQQSPVKADDASLSSSSATSGHVSLDTIRMKRIISMKRLTSINKTQTKSITSDTSKRSIKSPEIIQQIVNRATSASRSSYDNGSETSTETKVVAPNIIVEETSTSGVISNSECSFSGIAKSPIKKDVKKVYIRSVVMYNVGCQSMEDVLRTRCDEWVFRFVQIMEEVLRVKLQEKLPFDNKQYPAPRDLQEAARSVIKKFSNNFSVVDAANKLSFILYKTSDEDGKIAVNILPSDYMEIYSYGVFLVETFQDMSADCKEKDCMKEKIMKPKENQTDSCSCYEVNAASDSLKKLLYDIQNANLETFVDHPRDLSADNTSPDIDQFDFEAHPIEKYQDSEDDYNPECHVERSPIQPEDWDKQDTYLYNLGLPKRKSESFEDDEAPPNVSMSGKDSEPTFFNSLQLQRTIGNPENAMGHSNVEYININTPTLDKPEEQCKSPDETRQNTNINNLQIHFSKGDFTNAKSQTKVVCNFTVNADIERKVKARQIESEYEDFDEIKEKNTDPILAAKNGSENHSEMNDESNKKFRCFMGRLARTLGDILTEVKLLCDEYVIINELTNVTMKSDMRNKMEMAYMLVGNIHRSLDSISKRDHDNDKNMQVLLKVAKLHDYIPGDKLCSEYRYMINKCKEKAEEFHNTIQNILKMVRV